MGRSDPSNKQPILQYLMSLNNKPMQVLDLGIGHGEFGMLIKERINPQWEITGVEIWANYRHEYWKYYDNIVEQDIRSFVARNNASYDIILLVDVLEHFSYVEGRTILEMIIEQAKEAVVISTPVTVYPQGAFNGNSYEEHKYFWSHEQLLKLGFKNISLSTVFTYSDDPEFAELGVYTYEKARQ